ncbi:hypothetical protein ACR303_19875 [Bacillus paralicheniformis]|nr:hypothetical protein [Bacillus paralicheniformis]QSF97081.1 hypothetical protein DI291_0035 [Bacillus paralicheniformis]RZV63049.1 hypothetical protein EX342_11495 [Bacillus paralicheniformis]
MPFQAMAYPTPGPKDVVIQVKKPGHTVKAYEKVLGRSFSFQKKKARRKQERLCKLKKAAM